MYAACMETIESTTLDDLVRRANGSVGYNIPHIEPVWRRHHDKVQGDIITGVGRHRNL